MKESDQIQLLSFPPPDLSASLIDLYFRHVNPFLPLLHEPTFRASYAAGHYRRDVKFGGVVLLVFAIASRYSNDPRVLLAGAPRSSAGWKFYIQTEKIHPDLRVKLSGMQSLVVSKFPNKPLR